MSFFRVLPLASLCLFALPVTTVHAITQTTATQVIDHERAHFLKRQMSQGMSVGKAVRAVISHFPQQTVEITDVALQLYPDKYREILYSAISAHPASTEDIVALAISRELAAPASIVEIAIKAEPSYADIAARAGTSATPDALDDIVRVAVLTEPDSADAIVHTLSKQHPGKVLDIITSALQAVPFVGEYVVTAMVALLPEQKIQVLNTAALASAASEDEVFKILRLAQRAGMPQQQIMTLGQEAGLSASLLAELAVVPVSTP